MNRLFLSIALLVTVCPVSSAFAGLAMTPAAPGYGPFADNDNNGWAFTVDSSFFVTGLSAYDVGANGFGGDMSVDLWHHSTQTLLASVIVPAAGDGTLFPTVAITPVALSAGEEYSVAAARVDRSSELWDRWPNSDVTFYAPVSGARQVYGGYSGLFPGIDGYPRDGFTTAGGNFTYSAIPEPSTLVIWSLLGTLGITVGWWRRKRSVG
jgi:hypothetical protein